MLANVSNGALLLWLLGVPWAVVFLLVCLGVHYL